jgi:hypothetical protein
MRLIQCLPEGHFVVKKFLECHIIADVLIKTSLYMKGIQKVWKNLIISLKWENVHNFLVKIQQFAKNCHISAMKINKMFVFLVQGTISIPSVCPLVCLSFCFQFSGLFSAVDEDLIYDYISMSYRPSLSFVTLDQL